MRQIVPVATIAMARENTEMKTLVNLIVLLLMQATTEVMASENVAGSASVDYVVKANDTVSSILYALGVGAKDSPYRIYGADGFLAKLKKENPTVDLDHLAAGERIRLVLPAPIAATLAAAGGAPPPPAAAAASSGTTLKAQVIPPPAEAKATAAAKPAATAEATASRWSCGFDRGAAIAKPPAGSVAAIKQERYEVREGDAISKLLYARGVGRPDGFARLFGSTGWIARNQLLNAPYNIDIMQLQAGVVIELAYPVVVATDPCAKPSIDPAVVAREQELKRRELEAKKAAAVVAAPEKASLEEIASLPPEQRKRVDTQTIVKKLDDDAIAKLDNKTAESIPEEAIEEKAAEVSIFDADKPGMDKLFKNFKLSTPAAYLGARVGFSIADREEKLLSRVMAIGLLAEVRDGPAQGLRVIYETVPKVTVKSAGYEQSLEYNRFLFGWAFEFPAPALFDLVHITPRLGRYQIDAQTPAGESSEGEKLVNRLSIPSALGAGLEVDAEWAKYFYVLRFWGSRDIVLPLIKNKFVSITTRAGIDAYVKGASFTLFDTKFSPNYLIFTAYEGILLRGDSDENKGEEVALDLPTAGIGFTVTTN